MEEAQPPVHRAILVLKRGITPFARRIVSEMAHPLGGRTQPKLIECFEQSELLVNVTAHTLVPRHEILSDADKSALLVKYKLRDSQLPRIQVVDPISRYFGAQKGQVFKIIRLSETAGRYVTYRIVT